jgi:hypothetical protein
LYRACASLRFVFCGYGIDNTVNRAVVFNGTILPKQDRTTKTGLTSSTGPYSDQKESKSEQALQIIIGHVVAKSYANKRSKHGRRQFMVLNAT